jgi:hypothetical protein
MDDPYSLISEPLTAEVAADWQQQITEALAVEPRITSIDEWDWQIGDNDGVVYVSFNITLDNQETQTIAGIPLAESV